MSNQIYGVDENTHKLVKITSPIPEPGPSQALIQIEWVSLNSRDLLIKSHNPMYPGKHKQHLIPCCDGSGTIVKAGPSSAFVAGDRVVIQPHTWYTRDPADFKVEEVLGAGTVDGTLRQYMVVDDKSMHRLPEGVSTLSAAAAMCTGGTVYQAFFEGPEKSRAKPGRTILTQGTGGISTFAIQLAVAAGARVIATSSSDAKLDVAIQLGATHTINYRTNPNWEEKVLELTGGKGVDIALDVGGTGTIVKSLAATKVGGWVMAAGFLSQGDSANMLPAIVLGAKTVWGVFGSASAPMIESMLEFMDKHKIDPYIGEKFAFNEAEKAFELYEKQNFVGKVAICTTV